jgi:regulator of protease activity HflC (stomatin/prohibitin superfamily)
MDVLDCSNSTVRRSWGVCTIIAIIVSSTLIGVSLKKLTSLEYGIEYDVWAKTLDDAAKQGGLFLGPPGYKFVKFPSTQISADLSDTCLSRDGLRVGFSVSFQYQMPVDKIVNVIEKYRDYKGWSITVQAAGNSAVQHTCSDFNVTDFQSLRAVIQDEMFDNLKIKLEGSLEGITDDGVYALASSLQLRYVDLPSEYREAVSGKQRAEEDIALARNQRIQETTKSQTELLAAKEEAQKIFDTAINDANVTIFEAELKKEETLFAFKEQKDVLVEAKENFNLNADGVLAYMTNQLYAATKNLDVTVGEPARISRKDEL